MAYMARSETLNEGHQRLYDAGARPLSGRRSWRSSQPPSVRRDRRGATPGPRARGAAGDAVTIRPGSVWSGSDAALLKWAVPFYWRRQGEPAMLDATFGKGTFWKGRARRVVGVDLRPTGTVQADHTALPFRAESFDVVIYDPPHMDDVGRSSNQRERYQSGTGSHAPFFREADRVLRADGLILAKISDQVHGGHANWNHVTLMTEASERFHVCDLIVKVRPSAQIDPKWKQILHVRKQHAFWVVCRKGPRC